MIAQSHTRLHKVGEAVVPQRVTPEGVCPSIKSRENLDSVLEWYSYPFIRHRVPDNAYALRRYVEKTRPALRWFCKKYGVTIPAWLEGNGPYDQMSEEDHAAWFGPEPLHIAEFEEIHEDDGGR